MDRMKERPNQNLVTTLQLLGAKISYLEKDGFPPLKIKGGTILGGEITVPYLSVYEASNAFGYFQSNSLFLLSEGQHGVYNFQIIIRLIIHIKMGYYCKKHIFSAYIWIKDNRK